MKWILSLFLVPCSVLATTGGHIIGNGGDVLICQPSSPYHLKVYDLVEGEILSSNKTLPGNGANFEQKAEDIVKRLTDKDGYRVKLYIQWIRDFISEAKFLPAGVQIIPVPDISVGVVPDGCQVKQAITQTNLLESQGKRYLVDSQIWSWLDEDQRAALVVHEIIYREALSPENQQSNSYYVREFNSLLHADGIRTMNLRVYHDFLFSHRFARAEAHGVPIQLYSMGPVQGKSYFIPYPVEYYSDDVVKAATLFRKWDFEYGGAKYFYDCSASVETISARKASVMFNSDANIRELKFPLGDGTDTCRGGEYVFAQDGVSLRAKFDTLEFSQKGEIEHVALESDWVDEILNFKSSLVSFSMKKLGSVGLQRWYDFGILGEKWNLIFQSKYCDHDVRIFQKEDGSPLAGITSIQRSGSEPIVLQSCR